jgi:phosphoribosylamine--glycine ligase
MNILVIGSGGREHAICWKLRQSSKLDKLYIAPGNAGIAKIADGVFPETDVDKLLNFVEEKSVDCIIVGPEAPLADGIVDFFQEKGVPIFGPSRKAAQIESSKIFSKNLMKTYGIPTAEFEEFSDASDALEYLKQSKFPLVIKADGLAAGKGVLICEDKENAEEAVKEIMINKAFGEAGKKIVIEEFLEGEEASIFAFCDGKNFVSTIASQDHKRALEGDQGLNTGGMGAYAPTPVITDELKRFVDENIFAPTLKGLAEEGAPYTGVLYVGLMIADGTPKVLEFNCRFGDPETQVVLPLMKTDLVDIVQAVLDGTLDDVQLEWHDKQAVCVILASGGYPVKYEKGKVIRGMEDATADEGVMVFHAGTKLNEHGEFITAGGRVLGVTAIGETLDVAVDIAYDAVDKIHFEKMHFRSDIAHRAL